MLFTTKKDKEHSIVFPMLSRLLIDIHPSIFTSLYISLSFLQEIVLLFKYWGSISRAFLHFYNNNLVDGRDNELWRIVDNSKCKPPPAQPLSYWSCLWCVNSEVVIVFCCVSPSGRTEANELWHIVWLSLLQRSWSESESEETDQHYLLVMRRHTRADGLD